MHGRHHSCSRRSRACWLRRICIRLFSCCHSLGLSISRISPPNMPPSPPPPAPSPPPWLPSSPSVDRKPNGTRGGNPTIGEGGLAETRPNAPRLPVLHDACRPPLVVVAVDVDVALPEIPPNAWDSDTHESSINNLVKVPAPEVFVIMLGACLSSCMRCALVWWVCRPSGSFGGVVDDYWLHSLPHDAPTPLKHYDANT